MRDANAEAKVVQSIDAKVYTSDENGASVDLQGYEGALIVMNFGISGDTLSASLYVDVELEDSPDNSTWTNCEAGDIRGAQSGLSAGVMRNVDAAAEDELSYQAAYVGTQRYIRPVYNITGTHSNGMEFSCDVIKMFPRIKPAA